MCKTKTNGTNTNWPRYNSSQTVQPKRKLNTESDEKQKNRQHRCRHTTCSKERERQSKESAPSAVSCHGNA